MESKANGNGSYKTFDGIYFEGQYIDDNLEG